MLQKRAGQGKWSTVVFIPIEASLCQGCFSTVPSRADTRCYMWCGTRSLFLFCFLPDSVNATSATVKNVRKSTVKEGANKESRSWTASYDFIDAPDTSASYDSRRFSKIPLFRKVVPMCSIISAETLRHSPFRFLSLSLSWIKTLASFKLPPREVTSSSRLSISIISHENSSLYLSYHQRRSTLIIIANSCVTSTKLTRYQREETYLKSTFQCQQFVLGKSARRCDALDVARGSSRDSFLACVYDYSPISGNPA